MFCRTERHVVDSGDAAEQFGDPCEPDLGHWIRDGIDQLGEAQACSGEKVCNWY